MPDIQKFCKNIHSKIAEQNSLSLQTSSTEASSESTAKKEEEYQIKMGSSYEIHLRNYADVETCDMLIATMGYLPSKYFQASTWQIINNYFAKRHQENLELEAITNYQKVKEQKHVLVDPNDVEGLKE